MMETAEVRLRAVEPEDVDFMMECESDEEALRWSDYKAPLSKQQLMEYAVSYDADPFRAGQLRLIAENALHQPVGVLDLYDISVWDSRAYIGLTVHPRHRNAGYGLSILEAFESYNSSILGLRQITAKISTSNSKAMRLFEKAHYERIALLPSWHRVGSSFQDFHLLSLKFL